MVSQFILGQSHYGVGGDTKNRAYSQPNKQRLRWLRVIVSPLLCCLEINIDHYCAMSGICVLKFSNEESVHHRALCKM